jgi:hypothetical protein
MKEFLSLGFSLLLKVIVPGMAASVSLIPLLAYVAVKTDIYAIIDKRTLLIVLGLSIGLLVTFLDNSIYRILEGYKYWPDCLRKLLTKRLNKKIRKREAASDNCKDPKRKQVLWEWLALFPLKKKTEKLEMEASLPTLLGNILDSYESYPASRYGLSGIFFWPRIWLILDNEQRKEINTIWAEADCAIYLSFVFFWISVLYFLIWTLDYFNIPTQIFGPIFRPLDKLGVFAPSFIPIILLLLGVVILGLSYSFYRISLQLHVRNGSYFQSVFDLHRKKLRELLEISESDADFWKTTWSYLKYGLKKCDACCKYYPLTVENCPHCKKPNSSDATA